MSDCTCLAGEGISLDAAVFLAEACQEAYAVGFATTAKWIEERRFSSFTTFDVGNTQGFWAEAGEIAMLAFRGTSNPGQWIRDLRILPALHPWGLIHRGFKTGVRVVAAEMKAFAEVARTKKHVWITGHSLGGALAVVAAADFKIATGMSPRICTYGQPRVGYWNFADRFDIELSGGLQHFINQSDVVARVPPGLLFKHCGIPKRIVKPGVLEGTGEILPFSIPMPDLHYLPTRGGIILESGETLPFSTTAGSVATALNAIPGVEPKLVNSDVPGLSEREFLMLQLQLGAAAEDYQEGVILESATEGLSIFDDHAISEYIRLLAEIQDAKP